MNAGKVQPPVGPLQADAAPAIAAPPPVATPALVPEVRDPALRETERALSDRRDARRVGQNLRTLAGELRGRERTLVGYAARAFTTVRALAKTALTATSFDDLRQLVNLAQTAYAEHQKLAPEAGKLASGVTAAKMVLGPILDLAEFVLRHPDEALEIISFVEKQRLPAWNQPSAWMSTPLANVANWAQPLPRNVVDVAIIGAAASGAVVAFELASERQSGKPLDVLILERDRDRARGRAATFRNGGMVVTVLDYVFDINETVGDRPIQRIQEALGISTEDARRAYETLMHTMRDATKRLRDLILRAGGPDVGFSVEGTMELATSQEEVAAFRRAVAAAREVGLDWSVIDRTALAGRFGVDSPEIAGAMLMQQDGQIHPQKLVRALLKRAHSISSRVETAFATQFLSAKRDNGVWSLETSRGTVRARNVVDAREAFAKYPWRQAHYSQVHTIKAPGGAQARELGKTNVTHKFSFERLVGDDELLMGTADVPVSNPERPPRPLVSAALYSAAIAKKIHPELRFDIQKLWGGIAAYSKSGLPSAGKLADGWYIVGDAGATGMSLIPAMGAHVAYMLSEGRAGRELPNADLFSPRCNFTLALRQELHRKLAGAPGLAHLRLEDLRIDIEGEPARPTRPGELVLTVSEPALDAMNTDLAMLAADPAADREKREAAKQQWLTQQVMVLLQA